MPDQIWPGRELLRGVATIAMETHLFAWLGAGVASQVYIKHFLKQCQYYFQGRRGRG